MFIPLIDGVDTVFVVIHTFISYCGISLTSLGVLALIILAIGEPNHFTQENIRLAFLMICICLLIAFTGIYFLMTTGGITLILCIFFIGKAIYIAFIPREKFFDVFLRRE